MRLPSPRVLGAVLCACGLLAACSNDSSSKDTPTQKAPTPPKVATGSTPETFECKELLSLAELQELLGQGLAQTESPFAPPSGVPRPCTYSRTYEAKKEPAKKEAKKKRGKTKETQEQESAVEEKKESWRFDIDCRIDAHRTARRLMKQHAKSPTDAGVEAVQIGKGGLDHHGVSLLFIDDDTPCYVQVIGPDPERRKLLAKRIQKRLTMKTAPMRVSARAR